jgi:hypothetical protein
MNFMDTKARASFLRQKARGKNAPKDLVRMVHGIQRQEAKIRATGQEWRDFRKEFKEEIKKAKRLRRKKFACKYQLHRMKCKLGMYNHPDFPVPLIFSPRLGQ